MCYFWRVVQSLSLYVTCHSKFAVYQWCSWPYPWWPPVRLHNPQAGTVRWGKPPPALSNGQCRCRCRACRPRWCRIGRRRVTRGWISKAGSGRSSWGLGLVFFHAWGEPRACFFFGEGPSRQGGWFLTWSHRLWADLECDVGVCAEFVRVGRPRRATSRCAVPPARTAWFGVVVGHVPTSLVSCCHTHHSCCASSDNIWAVSLTYVRQRCKQTFPRSTRSTQLRNVSHSLSLAVVKMRRFIGHSQLSEGHRV